MATQPRHKRTSRPFRWTSAWLARLPDDGNRYEALDGALLVTPQAGPAHQHVAARLTRLLDVYLDTGGPATVFGPGAIKWKRNELQPDVMVVPGDLRPTLGSRWTDFPVPLLVIEILSPGSERHDRFSKREAYLALGIQEYWVVDIAARTVSVFRPGADEPQLVTESLRWEAVAGQAPLVIDVHALLGGSSPTR